jgi:hypothetical protein
LVSFAANDIIMDAVVIEIKNKKDVKFWLEFAKKICTRAKSVDFENVEDTYLAMLIEKGRNTEDVSLESIMTALGK